ncbi:MAG: hypothetical protein KAJ48_01730, partial [Elusimicrobiales bacterium]|nr:hypothetical protein [Elusimicrobiales bacterium]
MQKGKGELIGEFPLPPNFYFLLLCLISSFLISLAVSSGLSCENITYIKKEPIYSKWLVQFKICI